MRVLGPVQLVTTSGRSLDLPSASQRRLVALLATEAPRSLRADWICDVLTVSPSALRTTISRVRRAVGDGMIAGSQGRYRLAVPVDAALFTSALSAVSSRDDRTEMLERALAMWTGPPLDEFSAEGWAGPEVVRLTELHASAVEDHAIELIAARRWAEPTALDLLRHLGRAGNPLYATQLVRHWAESGRLVLDARVELADHESGEEVPANLRDLLWSRVTALGNDVLEVLSAAAVLGTEFAEDAVIDMVEIPERVAMDALDLAERARLVVDVGPQAR